MRSVIATLCALAFAATTAAASPAQASAPATVPTLAGTALPLPQTGTGANVPFIEYEAEHARTNGTILAASRAYTRLAAEASGRRAVALDPGEYVEFGLARAANAVDLRYSIPDGPDTELKVSVNGQARQSLRLTATYSHVYGLFPFTNNKGDGGQHHFFDSARTLFSPTVAPKARVRFTATTPTVLDLADFELTQAAAKPAGFLDATAFGADPTGVVDSGQALQGAIDAARGQQAGMYIPAGTYKVTRKLRVDNVTVHGAGPWHTTLTGAGVGVFGNDAPNASTAVHLKGFAIFGGTTARDDSTIDSGLGGSLSNSTVDGVWIEHTKVGMWFDGPSTGLSVSNSRIQNVWADGINLHDGVTNSAVRHTFVRNTGDDAMAMWSSRHPNHHNLFEHNTVSLPVLANGYGIYGGYDNAVRASIAADTVTQGGGIHVANRFGSVALSGKTTLAGNLLLRTGSLVPNDPVQIGAIWLHAADSPIEGAIAIQDTQLIDSSYAGIQFHGKAITNVSVERVAIVKAGTFAVQIQAPGKATFGWTVATGLGAAGVHQCGADFRIEQTSANAGWTTTSCGLPPKGQLEIAQAEGIDFGFKTLGSNSSLPIVVTNPGPSPVSITAVRPPDGYAAAASCTVIPVGGSCTIDVTFTPTASRNYDGRLVIESSSPAGPYVVGVKGIGFDPNGNLALGRTVTASSSCCFWLTPGNLVDGNRDTYFESLNGVFPQTITLDLGQTFTVGRIVLKLPIPWGDRVETIAVSADGVPVVPSADYVIGETTITLTGAAMRQLTLTFTGNTGWPAAQLSEIEVYAR